MANIPSTFVEDVYVLKKNVYTTEKGKKWKQIRKEIIILF